MKFVVKMWSLVFASWFDEKYSLVNHNWLHLRADSTWNSEIFLQYTLVDKYVRNIEQKKIVYFKLGQMGTYIK